MTTPSPSIPAPSIPDWAIDSLIRVGKRLDARGWVPATAGNFSLRLPDSPHIAITASGWHKGFLAPDAIMLVDANGAPLSPGKRPSAETGLHCQIYQLFPDAHMVLHGHSIAATVLSMENSKNNSIILEGYELLKIFELPTHDVKISIPLIDNSQDICKMTSSFTVALTESADRDFIFPGYIIRGHGVYVWGKNEAETLARLEGLEFLLACELERKKR